MGLAQAPVCNIPEEIAHQGIVTRRNLSVFVLDQCKGRAARRGSLASRTRPDGCRSPLSVHDPLEGLRRGRSRRKPPLPPTAVRLTEESCKARLSLHRVDTCISWRKRLHRVAPVSALSVERVQIDMQLLENPEISGVEYQQATLAGYESGNTFSRNSKRTVPICGITDVPLNLVHIHPRLRGRSNPCEQSRCGVYSLQHR
jgi:hypothetical protein